MHIYEMNKLETKLIAKAEMSECVQLGLANYSDWFMRLISHYIMVINK